MEEYTDKTVSELEALNMQLMNERDAIALKQQELKQAIDRKKADVKIKAKYDAMSASEKAALAQIISSAGGIKSKEEAGHPGE